MVKMLIRLSTHLHRNTDQIVSLHFDNLAKNNIAGRQFLISTGHIDHGINIRRIGLRTAYPKIFAFGNRPADQIGDEDSLVSAHIATE